MVGKISCKSMARIMQNAGAFFLVLITVKCVMAIDTSEGSSDNQHTRHKRTISGQRSSPGNGQVSSSLASYTQFDWIQYTPTTPSPEDVNCYVEVPETRLVGGRCVNLGSISGCQAGVYLGFTDECRSNRRSQSRNSFRAHRLRRRQTRLRRRFSSLLQLARSNE